MDITMRTLVAGLLVGLAWSGLLHTAEKPSPDAVLKLLKEGNERFVGGASIHPHADAARLHQAGTENQGDHAYATVITCSDSRVPVERLFDAGVMDIFVIRVAGNGCDTDEIGSIEYGLAHVHTPVLVVLGHTQCGAVRAGTQASGGHGRARERNIPPLVDNIKPAVLRAQALHAGLAGKDLVPYGIEENVWQGIEDLFRESPASRDLVRQGKAKVIGAIYDVATGKVRWLPEEKTRAILARVDADPKRALNALAEGQGQGHGEPAHGAIQAEAHEGAGSHARGHQTVTVQAEKVELVPAIRLQELDRARHRKIEQTSASLAADTTGTGATAKLAAALLVLGVLTILVLKSGAAARMGLAAKLYAGFGSVVALSLLIGGGGYYYLSAVNEKVHVAEAALELEGMGGHLEALQNDFLLTGIEDREHGESILKKHGDLIEEYGDDFEALQAMALDAEDLKAVGHMKDAMATYRDRISRVVSAYREIEAAKDKLAAAAERAEACLAEVLHEHEAELAELGAAATVNAGQLALQTDIVRHLAECEVLALRTFHEETEFLLDKNTGRVSAMETSLGSFLGTLRAVAAIIPQLATDKAEQAKDLEKIETAAAAIREYSGHAAKTIVAELVAQGAVLDCNHSLALVQAWAGALAEKANRIAAATQAEANTASLALMALALLAGSALAFFIARAITRPINNVITSMRSGAEQVASASNQVSSSSQQMAGGASEQASSLEEISSSLEEMASMTRQNADNTKQANTTAQEAQGAAKKGVDAMGRMSSAIGEIKSSSDQTAKIIKTIDEIAFQTNLLALNAAVEAARAGDAGKGFAVVAEEVRNLAQRSAEAAKNTSALIEASQKNAENGVTVTTEVGEILKQIAGSAEKVTQLIAEVAAASNEQAQGIDQVNTAVSQMDKVTQSNAANAEESASASEELPGQAQELNAMVDTLVAIVGGAGSANGNGNGRMHAAHGPVGRTDHALTNRVHTMLHQDKAPAARARVPAKARAASERATAKPDQVIPLDDKELADF